MILDALSKIWNTLTGDTYTITKTGSSTPELNFDTIEECSFNGSSTVTSYPVEAGYKVTEYKFENPSVIEMKGSISSTGIFGGFGFSLGLSKNGLEFKGDVISNTVKKLDEMKRELSSLDIQTRNGLREGYTLTNYNIPENYDNFNLLEVEMTFEKILTVENAKLNFKDFFQKQTESTGISQVVELGESDLGGLF